MITVKDIHINTENFKPDIDVTNNMLKKVSGINFPGLYDEVYITLNVDGLTTVDCINRMNIEQNTFFIDNYDTFSSNPVKGMIIISLAEAIALIYDLTILPIQKQRLGNSLTSIDSVIDLLKFYLMEDNTQALSKMKDTFFPEYCPAWTAYTIKQSFLDRYDKLMKVHSKSDLFVDVLYSSVPIDTWFKIDDLLNAVDDDVDYRCIETIYFTDKDNSIVKKLLENLNYKITMCGELGIYHTVTFNISHTPDIKDINLIKESYKDFYKN